MTWLNASEHLAIDAATRYRVQELRSTASLAAAHDGGGGRAAGWTTTLRTRAALVLGLIGLAAVSCVGCAVGTRSVAADAGTTEAAWNASPPDAPVRIPTCQGMGSYNRAANLCVSEGL